MKKAKLNKHYALIVNGETIGVFDGSRAARHMAKKAAAEVKATKFKTDMWSSGTTMIEVRRQYE